MTTGHEDRNRSPEVQPLDFQRLPAEEQLQRASSFFQTMRARRTIRAFSPEPVPFALVEMAIKTAVTAPPGANQPPWRFLLHPNPQATRQIPTSSVFTDKAFNTHP